MCGLPPVFLRSSVNWIEKIEGPLQTSFQASLTTQGLPPVFLLSSVNWIEKIEGPLQTSFQASLTITRITYGVPSRSVNWIEKIEGPLQTSFQASLTELQSRPSRDLRSSSDPGRIRTLNPQSRNLIFYPVELPGQ